MTWKIFHVPTFLEPARGDHPGNLKGIESSCVTVLVTLMSCPGRPPPGRAKPSCSKGMGSGLSSALDSGWFFMELQGKNVFNWNFLLFGQGTASVCVQSMVL